MISALLWDLADIVFINLATRDLSDIGRTELFVHKEIEIAFTTENRYHEMIVKTSTDHSAFCSMY